MPSLRHGSSRAAGALFGMLLVVAWPVRPLRAQSSGTGGDFFSQWEARYARAREEQPDYITPMFTTTARIVQAWRSDFTWRSAADGSETTLYGSGKGLDFVPFSTVQFTVGVPPYTVHREPTIDDGYGDWSLLMKYRLISHPAGRGDDILAAFLGASIPTGGKDNGGGHPVLTPQLAAGKGWGDFDVQATAGVGLPTSGVGVVGHAITYNVAPQYHLGEYLWPEVELNGTTWRDGSRAGKTQLFVSPALYFGRLPVYEHLGFDVGVGMQVAVSQYHSYDHALDLSVLFPF